MTDKPNGSRLDDYTSVGIVAVVLLSLLTAIGGIVFLAYTGAIASDITITGNIRIVGTIGIWPVLIALGSGIGWIVIIAFRDIYGSKAVKQATDTVESLSEEEE
jgi:hypothetical protein